MHFQIKDIGRGSFIVHDLTEDERTSIIAGRPGKLGVNPIIVRSWVPNFSAKNETKSVVTTIWISINYLPIMYHSPEILIALGNKIGKIVALHGRNSSIASRVHLCIEINLSRALPTLVEVNSHQYEVIFENTHIFFPVLKLQNASCQKFVGF